MKRLLITPLLLLALAAPAWATPTLGGPVAPDGRTRVTIDFPLALRAQNQGGSDGYGLCVFTSIMHAARWQKETPLEDFQTLMRQEPGGGWPAKVDRMIARYAPAVDYFQYEGRDPVVIREALRGSRLPSVTYSGRDPHYRTWIAHMVNVVHYDDQWVCILDNNYIGANDLVWMTPAEFLERWRGKGSGWVVILLKEPPERLPPPIQDPSGVGQAPHDDDAVVYTWYYHQADPYRVYLYCDNDLVGGYDFQHHYFRFYAADEDKWLGKGCPPFPPPLVTPHQPSGPVGTAKDYGIPLNLFPPRNQQEERWTRKGQPSRRDELLKLLAPRVKPDPSPAGPAGAPLGSAAVMGVVLLVLCLFGKEV
jgi:hypothetical protein